MKTLSYLKLKNTLAIICAISILFSSVGCSVQSNNDGAYSDTVSSVINDEERLIAEINDIHVAWLSNEIESDWAISELEKYLSCNYSNIIDLASETIAYISLESLSQKALNEAQAFFDKSDYISAIKLILQIDAEYSQYNLVNEFLSMCQNAIVIEVSAPVTIEEYEKCISLLDEYLTLVDDSTMSLRKTELANELIILKNICDITERATKLYDNQKYKEAFFTLAQGLEKYPSNETLESNLIDFHDHYIIYITQQVNIHCELEDYKKALEIIDIAIAEYNCNEFELLRKSVNEQRFPIFKLTNNVVSKFKTVAQGWESEDLDVKKLANSTGTYVMKSGKQLLLGDYSGENVTILSFGGNIVASLAGIDAVLDIRDLSYDLVHWGEDEYFALYLAADVLALLPVVGVIKYYDHFKDASKLAESVGDIAKNADLITDTADELSTVVRHTDDIAEAAQNLKHLAKYDNAFKQTVLENISEGYVFKETINGKLLGLIQEKSGVEFVLQKLDFSDGRKIMGVFPKFDSKADIMLPDELYKASEIDHKKYCLVQLQKGTDNIFGKYWKAFSEEERNMIQNGILPPGYTWHHNETEGLMQLVDSEIHELARHTGGMSLWGRGY